MLQVFALTRFLDANRATSLENAITTRFLSRGAAKATGRSSGERPHLLITANEDPIIHNQILRYSQFAAAHVGIGRSRLANGPISFVIVRTG
jgi:hypothetical protein